MTTTVPLISNATSSHQNHTVTPFSRLQSSPAALHPPATLANNNFSPHPSSQTVNLRHPLLRALNFYRFQHNSSALTQILAQLVVSGLLFNPFAAGRTLLALSSLPSSLPLAVTLFFVLPQPDAFAANILLRSLFTAGLPTASAQAGFDQMPERGTVSWNAMIMGYGLHGQTDAALELLLEMEKCGSKPNGSTFVCILSACSQSGSVLEGWWCFDHMIRVYNIKPTVEHVGCMVDLLGRNGLLKDNADFVKDLTKKPLKALWGSLMSSCWTHSNWEIGKFVGRKLIEMMPEEVGPYILLSNIWAAEGKWEEVERVRVMMEKRGLQKGAGMSLVELDNVTDESLREDNWLGCNPKKRIVYSLLTEMGSNLKMSWTEFSASKECA
ncbi:pentatricopeptide repeat-containing protein At5g48910-like [Phalaenopsis equestris]|uniref:pentatricopeptide repeat-containing protein At5g48910-like n=1 Tax=Phalaenopsis equestris TaxID=78828 RepID=UPI0009E2A2E2|nr:pentatricopeptide repeat-containing protein At5g48910-like [Phalaenopsis equestris]